MRPVARNAFERACVAVFRAALRALPARRREGMGDEMEAWMLHRLRRTAPALRTVYVAVAAGDVVARGVAARAAALGGAGPVHAASGAARSVARRPAWAFLVVTTLAVPTAANTAVFAIVRGALFAPLPYPEGERLASVWAALPGSEARGRLSGPELDALGRETTLLSASGGIWSRFGTLGTEDGPAHVDVGLVSGGFFQALAPTPELGRLLGPSDDIDGAEPTVLLTHHAWTALFAADPRVVGKLVALNGASRRVVGVLPERFRVLLPEDARVAEPVDVFVPWGGGYAEMDPEWHLFATVGRLAEGTTLHQLSDELDAVASRVLETVPVYEVDGLRLLAADLRADFVAPVRPWLGLLAACALGLLLVASANTAGLLLVRTIQRDGELAVRRALGAGRHRLFAMVLLEGGVLFGLAALGGTAAARLFIAGFEAVRPAGLHFIEPPSISPVVVLGTLGLLGPIGLIASLLPALRATADPARGLAEAARGRVSSGGRARARIVSGQVAVSFVLLFGAGLMTRSLIGLGQVEPGFDANEVATFRVTISGPDFPYERPETIARWYEELRRRLGAVPGVRAVGLTEQLPLSGGAAEVAPYRADSEGVPTPWGERVAHVRPVSVGFFEAVSARLVEGRLFDATDALGAPVVAVVDERLAREAWPGRSALGEQMEVDVFVGGEDVRTRARVVGVVRPIKLTPLSASDPPQIWLHHLQSPRRSLSVAARVVGDPTRYTPAFREALGSLAPDRALFGVRALSEYVGDSTRLTRFLSLLSGTFAALSILLAALGLFGVLAFALAARRRELGIRMALGAEPRGLAARMVADGVRILLEGLAVGAVVAYAGAALVAGVVFGIPARDPWTLLGATGVVLVVGTAACALPALRVVRLSPTTALE